MLVILQNDPAVPAGGYGELLDRIGVQYSIVRGYQSEILPPLESVTALLVLGGAMGVHDEELYPFLRQAKKSVMDCLDENIPLLGICLGGQILAELLGGKVSSGCCCEKGTLPVHMTAEGRKDPLFEAVPDPFITFQWHNDSFDLPPGAVHLASSPVCCYQAFRHGNAWGLQFHPEVTSDIIADWCRFIPGDPPISNEESTRLNEEYAACIEQYTAASIRIFLNFLSFAGISSSR